MCVRHLAFVLLIWFPAVLHAQKAKQPCPAPQLDHGFFVPKEEKYPHEEKLIYTCDKGYKPTAEGWWATSTCENGQWSPNPQCIDETSCLPPIITNGNYRVNSDGWYAELRTIKVTCDDGYELKGQPERIRCINGTWSPFPVCEKSLSSCGEPPQIPHAVIIKRGYQEVFADTSKVQYECEDGYTTDGITTLKSASCSSGNWTGTPSCRRPTSSRSNDGGNGHHFATIDTCGNIPVVPNGEVVHTGERSLIYQCANFYKLVGQSTVMCYRDGTWSEVPTCKAAFCTVDTNARPELKSVGVKYIKDGGSERLECTDVWMFENFSVAQCIDGKVRLSACCNRIQLNTGACEDQDAAVAGSS